MQLVSDASHLSTFGCQSSASLAMLAVREDRVVASRESSTDANQCGRTSGGPSSSKQSSQESIKIILHPKQQQQQQQQQPQQQDETTSENEKVSQAEANSKMMIQSQPQTKSDQALKQHQVNRTKDVEAKRPEAPASSVTTVPAGGNLRSTSARIQQRQQRFLAAAAKSATSPTSSDIISNQLQLQQQLSRFSGHNRQVANARTAPTGQSAVATKISNFEKSMEADVVPAMTLHAPISSSSSSPLPPSPSPSVRAKCGIDANYAAAPATLFKTSTTSDAASKCLSAQDTLIVDLDDENRESRDYVNDFNAADSTGPAGNHLISAVAPAMAAVRSEQMSVTSCDETSEKENLTSVPASVAFTATVGSEDDEDLIERKRSIRVEGGFALSTPQQVSSSQINKPSATTNNYHLNYNNSPNNYHQQYQNQYHPHHQHQQQHQHHHHHQQQQQQQHHQNQHQHQQQRHHQQHHNNGFANNNHNINITNSTMLHYKFHNDCQSSVLTYEQVKRLDYVMDQTVPIHGRGNFPTLYVKLKELIRLVKHKLQKEHSIEIRDVILNGGAANYVLAPENSQYNDLDLIFGTDLSNEDRFDVIRDVVIDCLKEFYPKDPISKGRCCSVNQTMDLSSTLAHNVVKEAQLKGASVANQHMKKEAGEHERTCDSLEEKAVRLDDGRKQPDIKTLKAKKDSENATAAMDHQYRISCEQQINNYGPATNLGSAKQQQQQYLQMPPNNCAIKEAYVHKMVKVNDDDRWSLISLGVQQSEVNCGPANGSLALVGLNQLGISDEYFPALPSLAAKNLEDPCDANPEQSQTGLNCVNGELSKTGNIDAQKVMSKNSHQNFHHQTNHHYQQQRLKQFPNSIELKFVDRMRRKFEFSVDSFQIILDSLIQFYDYAPMPSIASQRDLMSSHPSSTVINTRPMITSKRRCSADCCSISADCMALMESNFDGYSKVRLPRDSFSGSSSSCQLKSSQCHNHLTSTENEFNARTKDGACVNSAGSRGYYQFQIDANPPSLTSEASSSGCSSSSSVVSSFSSSLSSCDEDHEDLYCDVDVQSSSSASTSSLLSSSFYSSDGGVMCGSSVPSSSSSSSQDQQRPSSSNETSKVKSAKQTQKNKGEKNSQKKLTPISKSKTPVSNNTKTVVQRISTVATTDSVLANEEPVCGCCAGDCCLGLPNNFDDLNEYDFETDESTSCAVISENFYPTVIGRSEYGNFKEALYHLEKKLIATRSPEEIRGGGLLKYCNLLVKNYKPTNVYQIRTLERYMCSRFFIDFSDLNQQQAKLESYLANHFSDDLMLKIDYLTILHNVVQRSTVCLMNHELRLTLEMIKDMAFKMNDQHQHQDRQNHLNQFHHQQQQQQQQQLQQQRGTTLMPSHINPTQVDVTAAAHQHQSKQFFSNQHTKPLLIQSGAYRVKLVNYSLAKPAATAAVVTTK